MPHDNESDLHSGLNAWRFLVETRSEEDSLATYLPLILSATSTLGVLPFAIMRFIQGEWLAGVIDTAIVIGMASLGVYVYRTRRIRIASIAISVFCIGGALSTVYLIGPEQIFWTYPALMAVFYLLRPREAIAIAVLLLVALSPRLMASATIHEMVTLLITITVMSTIAFAFAVISDRQREQLIQLATKDPLTGAGNRRGLDTKMAHVVRSQQRKNTQASLLLMDLDNFKLVNDLHGHATGDQILKRITEIVNLRIRVTDSLYRIGGEEFVILLEEQDLDAATHLAEQLRTLVEANELAPDQSATVSIGVAELGKDETSDEWLKRADSAMYAAKGAGRNQTSIAA